MTKHQNDQVEEIVWTPDMSVGVPILDDDHKHLIEYLNRFIQAVDAQEGILDTDDIFTDLIRYTEEHFAREEAVMSACGFKGLDAHRELHAKLKQKVHGCRHRYMLNPNKVLEREVRKFLMTWLTDHILKCDMAYRPSVEAHPEAVKQELKKS